ncbi:MAG: hypothetical protein WAK33_08580 [Silvibacterium sp.]
MNRLKCVAVAALALLHLAALGQNTPKNTAPDYPKFEVPVDFSFINVHPDLPVITSFNVFGGGLDIPITPHIQARPVEVDYLLTRFGVNGTTYTGNQKRLGADGQIMTR